MDDFWYRIPPWATTLVLHNWPVMLWPALAIWAAVRAYLRPGRPILLFLYGSVILTVAFEYQKHGLGPVESTIYYVFARGPNVRDVLATVMVDWLPVAMNVFGFALLALSVVTSRRRFTSLGRN